MNGVDLGIFIHIIGYLPVSYLYSFVPFFYLGLLSVRVYLFKMIFFRHITNLSVRDSRLTGMYINEGPGLLKLGYFLALEFQVTVGEGSTFKGHAAPWNGEPRFSSVRPRLDDQTELRHWPES